MNDEGTNEGAISAQPSESADNSPIKIDLSPKKKRKRWPIVLGVVVVVVIAAGVGVFVWHEQPSFCNAICHTPMDDVSQTYFAEPNTVAEDKWGNEVSNASAMLSVSHAALPESYTCMSCHVPTIGEQVSEGINWVTGNYVYPLEERSLTDLVAARGLTSDEFCLNSACHDYTRKELATLTSDMERNVHIGQHGDIECSDCHKAHRASINQCSQCHTDAEIPDGWLSYTDAKKLTTP
jgi:hypothetical protein